MRNGWREVTLGEVTTRRRDFTPVEADALYRVVGVQRSGWGLVDRAPVRGDSMKFGKLMELHTNDLVYRTITAFEAPSTVVSADFDGAFVTPQTFLSYVIDQSQLLPEFMAIVTTSPVFHEAMATRCVGSVLRRKTLSQSAFESIPLALPPREEQRRIVDLITAVDTAAEAAEHESAASACAWSAIARSGSADQPRVAISDLVSVAKSGGTPSRAVASNFSGSIPWLKSGEVRGREIRSTEEQISASALADSSAWLVPAGAILLAMYGATAGQVGQTVAPLATNQAVLALLADETVVSQDLLFHIIAASADDLKAKAVGAAQPNISKKIVLSHEVSVPPASDQPALVEALNSAFTAASAARDTAESLRALRLNLLTVLLAGEHEIPLPYDALLRGDAA